MRFSGSKDFEQDSEQDSEQHKETDDENATPKNLLDKMDKMSPISSKLATQSSIEHTRTR